MRLHQLLALAATLGIVPTLASAQRVTVNEQYRGICAATPLSSYTAWLALASGVTCKSDGSANLNGLLTTAHSTGTIDWSFVNGPVAFNGLYFSGSGTFYLDLMDGDQVLHSSAFTAHGNDIFILANWEGDVSRIRIRRESGTGLFGLGNGGIVFNETSQHPNGDPGDGSNGGDGGNQTNSTPEPATLLLAATGLGGVGALARRRRLNASK